MVCPLVFAISAGTLDGLPLDTEQRFELLITGAQSLFAVAILIDLTLSFRGALCSSDCSRCSSSSASSAPRT